MFRSIDYLISVGKLHSILLSSISNIFLKIHTSWKMYWISKRILCKNYHAMLILKK